jgi:hypothetical protein
VGISRPGTAPSSFSPAFDPFLSFLTFCGHKQIFIFSRWVWLAALAAENVAYTYTQEIDPDADKYIEENAH